MINEGDCGHYPDHYERTPRVCSDLSELCGVDQILAGGAPLNLSCEATRALVTIARWLDDYISQPHPALGRTGDICPFTRRASEIGGLLLTCCGTRDPARVDPAMLALRETFLSVDDGCQTGHLEAPSAGTSFRSIVTIFYGIESHCIENFIVSAHARLKPHFLAHKLMLGEFYPSCTKTGIRNKLFRPLKAPFPLLVIRPMVEADIEFLTDRDEFAAAYLSAHGARGVERLEQLVRERSPNIDPARLTSLARLASAHRSRAKQPR